MSSPAGEANVHNPPGLQDPSRRTIFNPKQKDYVHFEKYAAETDGAYTQVRVTLNPGGGTPKHFHTGVRETFWGGPKGIGIHYNGKELVLAEGETATVEVGEIHRFYNHIDEEVTFTARIEGIKPYLSEEFEKCLYVHYGLANDGFCNDDAMPSSTVHLAILAKLGDTALPGWGFWAMTPLLTGLCWYAKWSGEEERLLKKYWRLEKE